MVLWVHSLIGSILSGMTEYFLPGFSHQQLYYRSQRSPELVQTFPCRHAVNRTLARTTSSGLLEGMYILLIITHPCQEHQAVFLLKRNRPGNEASTNSYVYLDHIIHTYRYLYSVMVVLIKVSICSHAHTCTHPVLFDSTLLNFGEHEYCMKAWRKRSN